MKKILFFVFQFFTIALFSQQKDFLLKNGKVVRMEKYDSSAVRTLINGKLTAVITNPSTDQILKYDGANWVNSTGGGGGGETLDQTLALGNVTDTNLVFDETFPDPGSTTSLTYTKEWLRWEPLVKNKPYDVDFAFRQSAVNFAFGTDNDAVDEIMMYGWNLAAGGGLEKSSVVAYADSASFPATGNYWTIYRANNNSKHYNWNGSTYVLGTKRGRTAIGRSMESIYNAYSDGNMYTELHDVYVDPLGSQKRISSYTINTSTGLIGLYRMVSGESLKLPGGVGIADPDINYWSVSPGTFGGTDATGTMGTSIQSASIDFGGVANTTTFLGYNMSKLLFSGYSNIYFGNATLNNFTLGNFSAGGITATALVSNTDITYKGSLYIVDNSNNANYSNFQNQGYQLALYGYGATLGMQYYNFTTFSHPHADNFYLKDKLRIFTNSTASYIMGQSDLATVIGYDSGNRVKNVYAKQYFINTGSTNPTTSDIEAGNYAVWKNTTSGRYNLFYNNGGTIDSLSTAVSGGGGGGGIGGSTGATDNRLLRSDGTGGATVQSSAISVDDNGNITMAKVSTDNTLINFQDGYDKPAIRYYDGGATVRAETGVKASELQVAIPSTWHFSWNKGGDLQASGTNEIMRLDANNHSLTIKPFGTDNGMISFSNGYDKPAIRLYDGGVGDRYEWGLKSAEMQFVVPSASHFSWNKGGDLQATGTNEIMRLDAGTGSLLIGSSSTTASAILKLESTTKGFLPPRMTKTQRDAISSPSAGLVIYQTDNTPGLRCYNGTNWMRYTETAD